MVEVQDSSASARRKVEDAVKERIEALRSRERQLLLEVDQLAQQKLDDLTRQLAAIEKGTASPALPESPDEQVDPNRFVLNADAVIMFRPGHEDFLEKISSFGHVDQSSTYASQSYARGPALGVLKLNVSTHLWIYSCDRTGLRRKDGGDDVVATFSSPGAFGNVTVEDLKDGRYKVKLVPLEVGSFTLSITTSFEGSAREPVRNSPFDIKVRDPTEYPRIAENHDPEVHKISKPGEVGVPHVAGLVDHPSGVDFDSSGKYIVVADQGNHRIQVFDAESHGVMCNFGKKGFGPKDFNSPCDVVVDRENRVFVSDLLNHRIQVLDFCARAMELRHVGSFAEPGTAQGQLDFPKGLGVTEHGQLLVCDSGNHRVQSFDVGDFRYLFDFGSKGSADGQFTTPLDIAVNAFDEILVSDATNRIQTFDDKGTFLRSFGQTGRKPEMFRYPTNIVVNDENALFVCDQANRRVQVFNASDGTFLHMWGGSMKKGEDGEQSDPTSEGEEQSAAQWIGLRKPAGIAVNSEGLIVVSDYAHHVLYKF